MDDSVATGWSCAIGGTQLPANVLHLITSSTVRSLGWSLFPLEAECQFKCLLDLLVLCGGIHLWEGELLVWYMLSTLSQIATTHLTWCIHYLQTWFHQFRMFLCCIPSCMYLFLQPLEDFLWHKLILSLTSKDFSGDLKIRPFHIGSVAWGWSFQVTSVLNSTNVFSGISSLVFFIDSQNVSLTY